MSNSDILNRGLSLVAQAVQADNNGDLHAALKLYTLGIECFMSMMRSYDNPTVVNKLKPKVAEYLTRCEQIAAELNPPQKQPQLKQQHKQHIADHQIVEEMAFPTPPDSFDSEPPSSTSSSTAARRR
jgi:hypothetical protein